MSSVTFNPIGRVEIVNGRCFIRLDDGTAEAALGLEEYSHIQVIWWFNLYDGEEARNYFVMDKPYTNGPEKVGVFATRGPIRPNPIAVTACALTAVDLAKRTIEVQSIDAEDGTPVLDIKPYHPSMDRVRDAVMPSWCSHWPDSLENNSGFDWSKEFNFPE